MSEAARRLNRPAREPCRAQNEAPLPRTSTDRARGYVERRRASHAIASKTAIRNASVHAAHPSRNQNVAPPPSYGRVSMYTTRAQPPPPLNYTNSVIKPFTTHDIGRTPGRESAGQSVSI